MAFKSVVVNSAVDLKAAIETFAQANGWTLASDILSKNGCYVKLTVASVNEIRIQGAKNGDFTGVNLPPHYNRIYISTWPSNATVNMAAFNNPDIIWMTMNYDVVKFHHIGFGNMVKYGNWNGGQWFFATHTTYSYDTRCATSIHGMAGIGYGYGGEAALFWDADCSNDWDLNYVHGNSTFVECDLRGRIWEPPASNDANLNYYTARVMSPIHYKNPNVFNSQTLLSPFQVWLKSADGYLQCLGHVDHVRWVKLTNYNPGDLITLGSEKWKLYPWCVHDVSYPDGKGSSYSSPSPSTGVLGVAVKYDGP